LPGDIASIGQRIGVTCRDHHIRLKERVRPQSRCAHRIHDVKLDKDQHIGKGHTGQCGGKAGAVMGQLQPADGQPAKQPLQQAAHGVAFAVVSMRAIMSRLVKRETTADDAASSATIRREVQIKRQVGLGSVDHGRGLSVGGSDTASINGSVARATM
jgi:hypothetical protein